MTETETYRPERCLLVGVDTGDYDCEYSIGELASLCESADSIVVGEIIQHAPKINKATYVGSGKLDDIKDFCEKNDIDLIIFDCELTSSQMCNIQDAVGVRTIDRTALILDIFAKRAKTSEGKLQVHLAQLKYRLPRLRGLGTALSRTGGGIGTRGPGETKLESDLRHVRSRIESLSEKLEELKLRRTRLRQGRKKQNFKTVSLVGYTNVGKTHLLNALSGSCEFSENMLFATLDPTSRSVTMDNGQQVIFVDTVGFVSRLPHNLVEAFKSTFEEAVFSDLILNICDISSPYCDMQLEITRKLMDELGCDFGQVITVYNKCDIAGEDNIVLREPGSFCISAKTGEGIPALMEEIEKRISDTKLVTFTLPFDKMYILNELSESRPFVSEEYTDNGVTITGHIKIPKLHLVKDYII